MAFIKYAKAKIQHADIKVEQWGALCKKSILPAPDFQRRTAKVIMDEYDPSKYMLSHATIVASVDTVDAPHELGKHYVDGFEIDRQYKNYYITPETTKYLNNNGDSFERKTLLATYKSFVGAQSYIEHIQIPSLSKGKVIDAAARDVGDSIYIDILIANELKHKPLIDAIRSGQMGTLSMGCFTPGTQVSMANGTRVPIEDVSVGDLVVSHLGNSREVTNKQIHIGQFGMKQLKVAGVSNRITSTNNHPFFVKFPEGRIIEVRADELKVGDLLCFEKNAEFCSILEIESVRYEGPVYDMEVEDDHSYIVEGVAVHNCSTKFTSCSQCGNVAYDEAQLCNHIKYFKRGTFIDESGVERIVGEVCGSHHDPESVKFIEASWVANPAFKGAVLRNILSATETVEAAEKIHVAFSMPDSAPMVHGLSKAARYILADQEAPVEDDAAVNDEMADMTQAPASPPPPKPIKYKQPHPQDLIDSSNNNDSLIKSAMQDPEWRRIAREVAQTVGTKKARKIVLGMIHQKNGGWSRVASEGFSGKERLGISRAIDLVVKKTSHAGETRVYRVALDVGGRKLYPSDESYLAACRQQFGRSLTGSEISKLLELGRLL